MHAYLLMYIRFCNHVLLCRADSGNLYLKLKKDGPVTEVMKPISVLKVKEIIFKIVFQLIFIYQSLLIKLSSLLLLLPLLLLS